MSASPEQERTISPGFSGSAPTDDMALIELLATDAGRRLRLFSAIGMGIFAVGTPLAILLPPLLGKPDRVRDVMLGLCLALFALSLSVYWIARRTDISSRAVVRAGLLYVIVASGAMAAAETILATQRQPEWNGVSGICIWIVLFPLIMPCLPRQALAASLASASTLPLAYVIQMQLGGPTLPLPVLFKWWAPLYFCAGLAFVAPLSVQRLARGLANARTAVHKAGRYALKELVAEGGMGQVWRATHDFLPHDVAVKVIRPATQARMRPDEAQTLARRFRREAQAVAVLRSPHTVALFDYGVTDSGELFAVMEYLRGFDFKRLVEEHGALPPARIIHILNQVCLSLAEAHGMGLVHRDIKPANLMICRLGLQSDQVKVLDFGLVGAMSHAPEILMGGGEESTAAGTPGFVAPEVLRGASGDVRSDLFAVGVVAYWLLTGTTLFPREGGGEDIARHLVDAPVPPAERLGRPLPQDLCDVVLRCLAKAPEDRPETAIALRRELNACRDAAGWTEADADSWWDGHARRPTPLPLG